MSRKLTTEEFISKSKLKHGNKYDYSLVVYSTANEKVSIICPKHGKFDQKACNHQFGQGCYECSLIDKRNMFSSNTNEFVKKANKIHGNKFDYSLVEYINSNIKINIICPIHGVFEQTPNGHLKSGCPKCGKISMANKQRLTTEIFITKANLVHQNKYDYSLVDYIDGNTKVTIICPKHGEFSQVSSNHLYGIGCTYCRESKGERDIGQFLEQNNIRFIRQYKFDDCRNILLLSFDFYLPELNICIEYDGRQHYEAIPLFGGIETLNKQIINDNIKTQYCLDNGIKLIRIKYDEDIEERLNEHLNKKTLTF